MQASKQEGCPVVALSANGLRIPSPRALDGRVEPLDAYSAIVVGVADNLTPRVAALRIRGRRGESAGSAVVLSDEGHLITNAHVVGGATAGEAAFGDGTTARLRGGRHRRALRPGRRPHGPCGAQPAGVRRRRLAAGRLARRRGRQPARAGRLGDGRRGQRARPLDAGPRPHDGPDDRGRHPDRRGPQPRQLRWRAGRLPRAGRRHQHRGRRGRARSGRAHERHDQPDHLPAHARRPGATGVPRPRQQPRSPAAGVGRPHRSAHRRCAWSRWSRAARRDRPTCTGATWCWPSTAPRSATPARSSACSSTTPSARRVEITVIRNGALVDVVAEPTELVD